jgi:hypothetical protein
MAIDNCVLCRILNLGFSLITGNASLEAAVTWIENHENTPDIDEMPLVQQSIYSYGLLLFIVHAQFHKLYMLIWQTSVKIRRLVHIMNKYTVIKLQSLPSDSMVHSGTCCQ